MSKSVSASDPVGQDSEVDMNASAAISGQYHEHQWMA